MLELSFVREHAPEARKNLARRGNPQYLEMFDELVEKDRRWRELKAEEERLRGERNKLSAEVNALKREGKPVEKVLEKAKFIPRKVKEMEAEADACREKVEFLLARIPNILHESVPEGKDESENAEVRRWGEPKKPAFALKHHGELAQSKGLADFSKAVDVSGAGFYYLKGNLALLDLALQRFAVEALAKKGYITIIPPLMLRRKPYEGVTDLADFENVMYKIEGDDLFLIATSEHPIAAMHMDEILEEKNLPLKYCGISPCFRREIGKHSIDERGLFRVHQFSKVEQFIFCKPEDSWKFHEELLKNAEELIQALGIPYRVLNVCTGDIGTVAAKKYDIEAWSPREGKYFEIVSCSNCASYQAARLKIRCRKGQDKELVHTLNSTALATSRIIRAILENFQNEDGSIEVPKVLQPYMGGLKKL
ncbi:MAG: serine--tRNA ligase [Candidatus Diapherotrites archaeon]|nr:serine--tRNA ligase [Candidatus Diapherotrites archaeon]